MSLEQKLAVDTLDPSGRELYRSVDGGELWHDPEPRETGASQLAAGASETLLTRSLQYRICSMPCIRSQPSP
jgi:hypothetical protein